MNLRLTFALAAVLVTAAGARAQTITATFNFDNQPAGTAANAFVPAGTGIVFTNAAFLPLQDSDGVDIPGSERFRPDPTAPAVFADDPTLFGRPAAPSPGNALEALFSPVLITLSQPSVFASFTSLSFVLDNDAFGDPNAFVAFLDGSSNEITRVTLDQSKPGFQFSRTLALGPIPVRQIVLPGGAFYDNLVVTGVAAPEPGTLALLGMATVGLAARRRRK